MIGTWRWNVALGLLGAILTLVLSWPGNLWTSALMKSLWGFVWLFAIGYAIRFVLGTVVGLATYSGSSDHASADAGADQLGSRIDLVTPPDVDSADKQEKGDDAAAFEPISFPKLQSRKPEQEAEEALKAVRHFNQSE